MSCVFAHRSNACAGGLGAGFGSQLDTFCGLGTLPATGCGGLRVVEAETTVKPSAEPASIRPASSRATPTRMVASSRPVRRANAPA